MSRLSRLPLKGRESVFTGGPEQYIGDAYASCPPSLEECVAAMEDCCEEVRMAAAIDVKPGFGLI
jgi:DASH complex subunit SPC19